MMQTTQRNPWLGIGAPIGLSQARRCFLTAKKVSWNCLPRVRLRRLGSQLKKFKYKLYVLCMGRYHCCWSSSSPGTPWHAECSLGVFTLIRHCASAGCPATFSDHQRTRHEFRVVACKHTEHADTARRYHSLQFHRASAIRQELARIHARCNSRPG